MPPPGHISLLRIGGSAASAFFPAPATRTAARVWRVAQITTTTTTHAATAWSILPQLSRHAFSTNTPRASASATAGGRRQGTSSALSNDEANQFEDESMKKSYFLSNTFMDRVAGLSPGSSLSNSPPNPYNPQPSQNPHANAEALPHRRRQAARRQAKLAAEAEAAAASSTSTVSATATADGASGDLPENSSTILSDMAARQPTTSVRRLASSLLSLAKPRLTVLVVLSAMAPYALYPVPAFLSNGLLETPSLSPLTLLFLTTGTTLCSASANALNMLYEPDTDARMSRTRNRPLVRMLVSRRAALLFAIGCGLAGVAALQWGVNPTVAFLGFANIALYAGVYTPMKRLSVLNTWVGALVGGIPPLMGWAAAAGETSVNSSPRELLFAADGSSIGGWLFAALLFSWQFPHFMALSWAVRHEYRRAGLRMLSWVNPARNGRVALRYAISFIPICVGLCLTNVCSWSFAATSLPVNLWLIREAYAFWKHEGHQGSARRLFWASVWHLPAIMVLALLQKKGMWTRVYHSVFGQPLVGDEDEDEFDDDDYVWEDEVKQPVPVAVPVAASSTPTPSSISCDNLIIDGDFSNTFHGWAVGATGVGATFGTYTYMPESPVCAYLSVSGTGDLVQIFQLITMVPDVSYTFAFDYLIQALDGQPPSGKPDCEFSPLNVVTPKRDSSSPADWPSFTIDLADSPSHLSVVRRATFNSYRKSFSVSTGGQQLACWFQATGPAQVSLAAMVLQPTECSAWTP